MLSTWNIQKFIECIISIYVHHMKSSKSFISLCAYSFFLLLFFCWCVYLTLPLYERRKKEKGLLTLSTRERLIQRCSFDKKTNLFSCIIYYTYKIRNWRSVLRSSFRMIDKLLNCNSLQKQENQIRKNVFRH